MPKEKIYREFRLQKVEGRNDPYGKLYLNVFFAPEEGREGAKFDMDWQNERDNPSYGWYGMHMTITETNASNFSNMLTGYIAPLIKKMYDADIYGSSVKPLEVCGFLDKQKIPQIVYYGGSKIFLKELRKNNLYEVRDLRYLGQRPDYLIADGELDAKYRLKARQRSSAPQSLEQFESRLMEPYEYEDLFKQSWRSMLGDVEKKTE